MTPVPMDDTEAWRSHAGFVAWPTLLFFVTVFATWVAVASLAWVGVLGWGTTFGLQTLLAYLIFTPLHEASHGNIAGRQTRLRRLETWVGWLSGVPLLAPYPAFRKLHLEHHGHTNHEEDDPDFWVAGTTRWSIAWRCATILPHYYWRILRGAWRSPAARDAVVLLTLTVYLALAIGLSFAGYGTWVLLAWMGPALVATGILAFVFDWLPHQPHQERSRYRNSRILLFPGLGVLTTNQSLHLIHHLYPRIPFYRYGTFFREARATLASKGAPIVDLRRKAASESPSSAAPEAPASAIGSAVGAPSKRNSSTT
ncbi:MAG: fatty acid desaturase [Thermoanaerobaculia bacterium]|nr:fatty acid desaturase [Thermoanaerobaculia bacterium]